MNPFTDEERSARMRLAIEGFCDQLRSPESLHQLVMLHKPATKSAGDFALTAMLNAVLMALIVREDYRGVQRLLVKLFGDSVTDVTPGDARQKGARP